MVFDLFTPSRPQRTRFGQGVREDLYRRQQGRCVYCGSRQRMDLMDIDHRDPAGPGRIQRPPEPAAAVPHLQPAQGNQDRP